MVRLSLVLIVSALYAQEPSFVTDVSLVRVDARVVGPGGVIDGLTREDFVVHDNGQSQPVVSCSTEDSPLDVVLLFDVSRSMAPGILPVAASAQRALAELRAGDRVAAMAFDTRSWVVFPLTDDLPAAAAELQSRLPRTQFAGGTHIQDAVDDAAAYLKRQPDVPGRRRSIIVLTDNAGYGPDFHKSVIRHLWEANAAVNGLIVASAETIAARAGTSGPQLMAAPDDVNSLAEQTGGEVIDARQAGEALHDMLLRLRKTYALYYRTPAARPGQRRTVLVTLSSEAKARFAGANVVARKGYFLPRP